MRSSTALLVILVFGLFTLWVETPWMWAIEQVAVFSLAGWCLIFEDPLRDRRGSQSATMITLAGVVLLCVIQLVARSTVDRWETTTQMYTWLAWLTAHGIGLVALRDADDRGRFLERVQLSGIAIAVLAILHRTTSQGKVFWIFETGRRFVMGVFPYDNQYAAFILLVLPGTLVRALRGRSHRVSWMAGAAVMVGSVISSSSVAGSALVLLETLVIVAIVCIEMHWPWKQRIVLAAGILALAAAIGSVSGWADIVSDLERHNVAEVRRQLTLSTLDMAREHPLSGWGMGTWTQVYPAYAHFDDGIFDNAAHNDWAQWAAEGGAPMLVLMAAFAVVLVRPAVRSVWGIGLLFVLGYSVMEFHFQERPQFGCFFFALAGAMMAGGESRRAEE